MAPPFKKWTPGGASPFARPAFPHGMAPYRPALVSQATGQHAFGAPAPPVGVGPVAQSVEAPPVAWSGNWRPTEAELQRWGGRAVLYGSGIPDHASTGVEQLDVLDATLPWPMSCDIVFAFENLAAAAGVTNVDVFVQAGVGRASWKLLVGVNAPTSFSHLVQRQPFRQINVRCAWRTPPAAGEIVAVSVGFGVVGV